MAEPMPDDKMIEVLNKSFVRGRNPSVQFLGGQIVSFDREAQTMRMRFEGTPPMNNGNGQVMGGFLGAMMDAVVAQLAVVLSQLTQTVSTLEQKASLLAPVRLPRDSDDPVSRRPTPRAPDPQSTGPRLPLHRRAGRNLCRRGGDQGRAVRGLLRDLAAGRRRHARRARHPDHRALALAPNLSATHFSRPS